MLNKKVIRKLFCTIYGNVLREGGISQKLPNQPQMGFTGAMKGNAEEKSIFLDYI